MHVNKECDDVSVNEVLHYTSFLYFIPLSLSPYPNINEYDMSVKV